VASVIDYIINLKVTGGNNVVSVAQQAEKQLTTLQRKAQQVGASVRQALSFSNFKCALMDAPGMSFLLNPYTIVGAGIGAVATLGAQAEQTSIAFRTLVGDESKAAGILKDINDFAAKTPFSNLELVENAKTMLNFGVEAGKVNGYLKQLGDISAGDKNKLSSLSLVFGQVASAGKMSGQDLLQFINAGFNPLKELEQMTGKTYNELQEMMSKGQIGFDAVAAAINHATSEGGKFYGMSDELSESFGGKLSTLVGLVHQQATALFNQLQPLFVDIVNIAMQVVPPIFSSIQKVVGVIAGVIRFIVEWRDYIGILLVAVVAGTTAFYAHAIAIGAMAMATQGITAVTKAWAVAQKVLNVVMAANPAGIVFAAVAGAVIYCWNKFAGFRAFILTMWDTMKGFGNIIKAYIIDRLQTMLSGLGKIGDALSKMFNGNFEGAWESAKAGVKDISGITSAQRTAAMVKEVPAAIVNSWQKNYASESTKDKTGKKSNTISEPGQKGSKTATDLFQPANGGKGSGRGTGSKKTAEALATGGTRNTSITMHIGKFFDNINVQMADKADTAELERTVLQCMNRALAIATSSDR